MNRAGVIKVTGILLLIFLISVLVRYPNINRPLSKHHEFITAIPLRVLQIWDAEGASKFNFNPVMNYAGEANKNINNHASTSGGMKDEFGNFYYVSHPQFAYIFPHLVFKALHIKPTVLSLEIFHLFVNFFSAVFIYLITCLLSIQRPFKQIFIPGLIAFIVYLFSPAVLWFQCNTYMSDTLVHLPFILAVYTILKLLMRKRFYSPKYLFYYALFLFLMIYTSFLGLFFAAAVFFYALIKLRKENVFIPLMIVTLGVSFFTLVLIIKQYSLINGGEAYVLQMMDRFSERGSAGGHGIMGFLHRTYYNLKIIFLNYATSYLPIFVLLGFFAFLSLKKTKMGLMFTKNGYRFLWLSALPVLMLHAVLLNYSGHDFVMLYGSLFLAVLVGILYDKLKRSEVLTPFVLNLGIFMVVLSSIALYYYINMPGQHSWKGDYYATSKDVGLFIKDNAQANEVVYIKGEIEIDPQLIVYAERNILRYNASHIDSSLLKLNSVVFSVNKDLNISIERNTPSLE